MTVNHICGIPARVGRKKEFPESMLAKFAAGTFDRVAAVLGENEDRTEFVRLAVDREAKRRERIKPEKSNAGKRLLQN